MFGMKENSTRPEPAERAPATPAPDPRRWKALALLCVANFMVILDSQIVILALPAIQADLGFTTEGVQWVLSAYLLAFGGLLLLGGRAGDLLGRRKVFRTGTVLFLLSSLLCGLAWTPAVLVGARVVQGVSAAMMAPTALSMLMTTFPEGPERARAVAVWGATGGLGATAALLVGGAVSGTLGWEWIFFLNLPVALGMLVAGAVLLTESRRTEGRRRYDPIGALTVTGAFVLLILAVAGAPVVGWGSPSTIGMLAGSALLFAAFVVTEQRSAVPLVPLRIFRSRTLVAGNAAMLVLGLCAWGMGVPLSLYAQQVLGYSPLQFGLATTAMTGMTLVGSFLAQGLVARAGIRVIGAAGFVLVGIGSLVLAHVPVDGSYAVDILPGLLPFGLGLGAGAVVASIAALAGVDERYSGVASGTVTAVFQIGGALGAAIVTTVAASATTASDPAGLTEGYQAAFATGVVLAVVGLVGAVLLPGRARTHEKDPPGAVSVRGGPVPWRGQSR
jgi:EmrB/QacA subfamily drug resistance transporter